MAKNNRGEYLSLEGAAGESRVPTGVCGLGSLIDPPKRETAPKDGLSRSLSTAKKKGSSA